MLTFWTGGFGESQPEHDAWWHLLRQHARHPGRPRQPGVTAPGSAL